MSERDELCVIVTDGNSPASPLLPAEVVVRAEH